jgi:membrane associated rhomboid family serine protease
MRSTTSAPRESRLAQAILLLGAIVGVLWALEILDWLFFDQGLDRYGIVPRSVDGLWGIAASPFLHGGFGHLAANTPPLFVLGILVFLRGARDFALGTLSIAALGGLAVWTIAADHTVHIGASGVIFGYLGLLLGAGIFERSLRSILVAVVVGLAYGGVLLGVLPGQPGISWEGHLFGFLAGCLAARMLARRERPKKLARLTG